jgi:SHS2 domain-containing protein
MPYSFLEDLATADVAFEARGQDLEELFMSAARATINTMVDCLASVLPQTRRIVQLSETELDILLFSYLQELIYYKDAEGLLLLPENVRITEDETIFRLWSAVEGEEIDASRHEQRADVKAVTLHCFELKPVAEGWKAIIILDV